MNIFKILARGDGSLKEPNISSLIGYLLDPNEDHGLKDKFLKILWKFIHGKKNEPFPKGKVDVKLEPPMHTDDKKNFCDIKITFTDIASSSNGYTYPSTVIFIENKIRQSLTPDQIRNQIKGIDSYLSSYLKNSKNNSLIFLTPVGDKYEEASKDVNEEDPGVLINNFRHLFWNNKENSNGNDFIGLLKSLGEIKNPETNHLISNFKEFILNDFKAFNFKTDIIKGKKNLISAEDKQMLYNSFLPSFCESTTLELFKNLSSHVETELKKRENDQGKDCIFKREYISTNKKGMISYSKSLTGRSFLCRFDLSPLSIKFHLGKPPKSLIDEFKIKFNPKGRILKTTSKNLELEINIHDDYEQNIPLIKKGISQLVNSMK